MEARRELVHIRDELDWYHRTIGEVVEWAWFDPTTTVTADVYDEPGERGYGGPVRVQTLWINVAEHEKRIDADRYDVRNQLTIAISLEAMRNAGVPNIERDSERVKDVFKYWNRYWAVTDFEILARFQQQDSSTIGIQAVEIDLRSDYPFEPALPIEG